MVLEQSTDLLAGLQNGLLIVIRPCTVLCVIFTALSGFVGDSIGKCNLIMPLNMTTAAHQEVSLFRLGPASISSHSLPSSKSRREPLSAALKLKWYVPMFRFDRLVFLPVHFGACS